MATTSPTGANGTDSSKFVPQPAPKDGSDAFSQVDLQSFLNLMIAELQNQDPLNPMDNAQMIEQMGQLRSMASTDKLTKTLDSVQQGQSFASASTLIGRKISALDDDAKEVTGKVEKASIVDGEVRVHVGESTISLSNVREILPG